MLLYKKLLIIVVTILFTIQLSSCVGIKRKWDRCDVVAPLDGNNVFEVMTFFDITAQQKGNSWYLWVDSDTEPLLSNDQSVECVNLPNNKVKVIKHNAYYANFNWTANARILNGFTEPVVIQKIYAELWFEGELVAEQTFDINNIVEPRNYIPLKLTFDEENTFFLKHELQGSDDFFSYSSMTVKIDLLDYEKK